MWSEPRRAHPAGVIIYSVRFLGVLLAPVIVVVAAISSGDDQRVFLAVALVVALIVVALAATVALAWAEWYRFTFYIEGRTLRVEQGLIVRKSTRLTPERIQSVDTKANLLFRLLGLVTLDVHTAGRGQTPEVSIPALTVAEAEALARTLREMRAEEVGAAAAMPGSGLSDEALGSSAAAPAVGPTWKLTAADLALFAVTSSGGVLALAALGPVAGALLPTLIGRFGVEVVSIEWSVASMLFGAAAALVFALFTWVVGSFGTALMYWDFLVVRSERELRIERGLLQRETRSVPLGRVQAVRLVEGPLRQAMRRVTIAVDAAGIASGGNQNAGPTVVHPILARAEAVRFIDLMLPGHTGPAPVRLPQRARRRYVVRAVAPALAAALPVAIWVPYGWAALLLPFATGGWGLLAYADAAWAVRGDVLALRRRVFARQTMLVRRARIQSISVSQHPLQMLAGLATISVDVAASPQPTTFSLAHVDYRDAMGVVEWVSTTTAAGDLEAPRDEPMSPPQEI